MAHLHKDANGHLLKNPSGHLVNDCPEARPCVDCQGTQPSAVVTITGPLCQDVAGVYEWFGFGIGPSTCVWEWRQVTGGTVHVLTVSAARSAPDFDDMEISHIGVASHFVNIDPTELDCVDGIVEGTLAADGRLSCAGDIATITFG